MKKLISLVLCLLTVYLSASVQAETEGSASRDPAVGYSFDFFLRLHPEALSDKQDCVRTGRLQVPDQHGEADRLSEYR